MKNIKTKDGITLISLVITIVVILILAAISVNYIMNKNGIIAKAREASALYANESKREQNIFVDEIDQYLNKKDTKPTCFAKGTKITLENSLNKNIEDIKIGDLVLTFNQEKGILESQEVYYAWKCKQKKSAFTLLFDNNETLSIVGEHDLFEKESLKYVMITEENVESFIGKHFYSVSDGKYVELISATKEQENTEYYSIYTKFNGNCIANGMLSIPDDIDYMFNIYNFNENLTIDHNKLALDIQKYGIFEFSNGEDYTKEEYEYMNMRYLNIAVEKGLITWEEIYNIREEYTHQE